MSFWARVRLGVDLLRPLRVRVRLVDQDFAGRSAVHNLLRDLVVRPRQARVHHADLVVCGAHVLVVLVIRAEALLGLPSRIAGGAVLQRLARALSCQLFDNKLVR